jgi:hypothetical protein
MLGDHFVMNSTIPTPDRAGLPLHLISPEGQVIRSFGSISGAYRSDIPLHDRRQLTPAGSRAVWSAWALQYVIERWSEGGSLERTLQRRVRL